MAGGGEIAECSVKFGDAIDVWRQMALGEAVLYTNTKRNKHIAQVPR